MAISSPINLGAVGVAAATNAVLTLSTSVAAGAAVIVVTINATSTMPASVTDSAGNTYNLITSSANGGNHCEGIYVALNVTALAAGSTITVTPGRADVGTGMRAVAFTGIATANASDGTANATGSTSAETAVSVGPINTTVAENLLFAAVGTTLTTRTFTPGAGWIGLLSAESSTDFTREVHPLYRLVSSTGSYTATGTLSDTGSTWAACMVALKGGDPPPTLTTVRPGSTLAAGGWTTAEASLHAALSDQSSATLITGTGV